MEPIFVSVREACEIINLGKTKFYELLNEGRVESTRIGTRRLIVLRSVIELMPLTPDASPSTETDCIRS